MPKITVTITPCPKPSSCTSARTSYAEPRGIVIEGTSAGGSYAVLMPRAAAELLMTLVERALADLDDPDQQELHKS